MKETKETIVEKKKLFDTKGKVITAIAAAVIVLVLVAVLMYIETGYGKVTVKNKSDLKLEYVNTQFVYTEGELLKGIEAKDINAHKTFTANMDPIDLLGYEANYEIRFKFENHEELLVDAGIFNDNFDGNIKIEFKKTDDPNLLKMKVKASNGILPSKLIDCNETYTINLSEGKVLE